MSGEAQSAGRGLVSIAGAKIWFVLTSYTIQLALPRLWTEQEYGLYASAMAAVSMLNNVLIAATIQSVSKFVSAEEHLAPNRLRQGLKIQLVIGTALAGAALLAAPWIAHFFADEALTPLLRMASVVFLAYALYATFVGSLNGRRLFQRQAALDALFATLRSGGIIGLAALGFGVFGAICGYAGAAAVILVIALVVVRTGRPGEPLAWSHWFGFMLPIWFYQWFLNGMMQVDLLVIKWTLTDLARLGGMETAAAVELANVQVGHYRAAQTFAFVPYQLMLSMTFIVFPMVSRATNAQDEQTAQTTIRAAIRFSLITLLAFAAPIAGAADGIMLVAYPAEYLAGAPALGVLAFGMAAFALFVISATILNGAGYPLRSAIIAAVALILIVVANRLALLYFPDQRLLAAATATTIGMVLALVATAFSVYLRFRTFVAPVTAIRVAAAASVGFFAAHYVPHSNFITALGALVAGFFACLVTLVVTRELTRDDLRVIARVVRR